MQDLMNAARDGDVATIKRLHAEGVDVTERGEHGFTAIMSAAGNGNTATVKFLQAAGASMTARDDREFSALYFAALFGKLALVQYILKESGESISYVTDTGDTVWDLLALQGADPVTLASLLKVMVMLRDAEITTRGRYFRAQLSSYLEQQRSSVVEHCPLPSVLLPIVADYAPTTPEDMWTDGLRIEATDPSNR
jgi:hypothetical protein